MSMSLPRRWGARTLAVAAALALIPAFSPSVAASAATGCRTTVPGDVNGDGLAELAVGESGTNVGAGAVHVFYGHKAGLVTSTGSARNDQYLTQNSPGMPGSDTASGSSGAAVALGGFDHDGCADLASGAYGEDASADDLASGFTRVACTLLDCDHVEDDDPPVTGAVVGLPGSSTGLTPTGARLGAMVSHASYWSRLPGKPSCDSRMTGCR